MSEGRAHLLQGATCFGAGKPDEALFVLAAQHSSGMLPPHDCQLAPCCFVNLYTDTQLSHTEHIARRDGWPPRPGTSTAVHQCLCKRSSLRIAEAVLHHVGAQHAGVYALRLTQVGHMDRCHLLKFLQAIVQGLKSFPLPQLCLAGRQLMCLNFLQPSQPAHDARIGICSL